MSEWMWKYTYTNELYHHGILGMKWGKRNGPPYPLHASDKSTAEKKAEKDGSSGSKQKKKFQLSSKQKKAIKIGAVAVGTALAAYGTYRLVKSGKLDGLIGRGKSAVNTVIKDNKVGEINGSSNIGKQKVESILGDTAKKAAGTAGKIKKLAKAESLEDTLKKVNPLRGTPASANNCTYSAVTGFLRQAGYDVTAKATPNHEMQNLGGVVEKCFKGAKVLDGTATKFGRSREDAAAMLVKRFGENAAGVCAVQWANSNGGHAFNWQIKDGIVRFFDSQLGRDDWQVSQYFNTGRINTNGLFTIARLDNAEMNIDGIKDILNL